MKNLSGQKRIFWALLVMYLFVGINSIFVYNPSPERFTLISVCMGSVLLCAYILRKVL
jgi:cytochrome b subunit of formate dehydrogenase